METHDRDYIGNTAANTRDYTQSQAKCSDSGVGGTAYKLYTEEGTLNELFRYHPANPSTGPKFENIREAGKYFAKVLLLNVPAGADRTAAIRKVREAVMTANAGVSLGGLSL